MASKETFRNEGNLKMNENEKNDIKHEREYLITRKVIVYFGAF